MEFPVTINSQDEFDGLVKSRLERERAKYADYDDLRARAEEAEAAKVAAEQALTDERTQREAAEGEIQRFQTEKQVETWRAEVAKATGVPADVLRGSTKEDFEAHAAVLKPLVTGAGPVIPTQGDQPISSTHPSEKAAFADFLTGHRD